MVIRSWRQQAADRFDDLCGLNPTAIGAKHVSREPMPFWHNRSETMPSKSKAQAKFMQAAAHNPKFAKEAKIPQSVAKEFTVADKKAAKPAPRPRKA